MAAPVYYTIQNNTFWLLPQKALYWEEQNALIISDLHLGKTGHFRKEGIAVPQGVYKDDLHCLFHIIQHYKPEQLIIAGDMFHSKMNKEVDLFTRWRKDISHLHIQLIKGNHDILLDDYYSTANITLSHQRLHIDSFCFVHDIGDVDAVHSPSSIVHGGERRDSSIVNSGQKHDVSHQSGDWKPETGNQCYYFSGHVHPGIVLRTGSRQSLRFPCYYFTSGYAVLPAFSVFSGMYTVSPKRNEKVFAIVNGNVMKMGR